MEEKKKILEMLAAGKITVAEAETLLSAVGGLDAPAAPISAPAVSAKKDPRYLRVEVDSEKDGNKEKVNVRVPFSLLRAGVKLSALMPANAQDQIDDALRDKGLNINLAKARPEDVEEMIEQLADLKIDVDSDKEKVRIYVE